MIKKKKSRPSPPEGEVPELPSPPSLYEK